MLFAKATLVKGAPGLDKNGEVDHFCFRNGAAGRHTVFITVGAV
jgi:hypothetical protein